MLTFEKILFKPEGDYEKRVLKPLSEVIKQMEEKLRLLSQRAEIRENFEKAQEKVRKNLNKPSNLFSSPREEKSSQTLSVCEKQKKVAIPTSKCKVEGKLILLFLSLLQKNN